MAYVRDHDGKIAEVKKKSATFRKNLAAEKIVEFDFNALHFAENSGLNPLAVLKHSAIIEKAHFLRIGYAGDFEAVDGRENVFLALRGEGRKLAGDSATQQSDEGREVEGFPTLFLRGDVAVKVRVHT